jgi:hypothetical protein
MAKKLKVGDTIRGYRVTKVFGPGAMAISYAAATPDGSRRIFLKQYKSPAPTVVWYGAFVDYQQELAARVRGGKASHYAVRLIDAFEEEWGGPCYFQAIELVESGSDLQHILDAERAEHERTGRWPLQDPAVWAAARHVGQGARRRRRRAARGQDRARRPQAAERLPHRGRDDRLGLPAQADRHGLLGARRPARAVARLSGLRGLGQLPLARAHVARRGAGARLGRVHLRADAARAARRHAPVLARRPGGVRAARARARGAPAGAGGRDAGAGDERRGERHPAPLPRPRPGGPADRRRAACGAERPHAAARAGTGGGFDGARRGGAGSRHRVGAAACRGTAPGDAARHAARHAARPPARAAGGAPLTSERVQLVGDGGRTLHIGVRTEVGKHLARQFGGDAEFWDARQFVIERLADGRWQVAPLPDAVNETLLNGEALAAPRPLRDGDVLAVGRAAKGIAKLPLTVRAL